jgi:PST family polysaccharide transporter
MTRQDSGPLGADGTGLRRGAVRGFLVSALAFAGNRILVFASTLVLARLLVPEDFGIVAAGMTLILYLEIGLDLGVGAALVYEQETGISERAQTAFTLSVLTSLLFTAVGWWSAPAIASFFQVSGQETLFRVLFCYLLLRGLAQVPDALLRRDLRFGRRGVLDVARGLTRASVAIALALLGYGAWSIVWGLLAGEVVGTWLTWRATGFRPTFRIRRAAVRALMGFGSAVFALRLVDALATDGDYLVVGSQLGPTQLGFYSVAFRLPELLLLNVFWVFSSVAFPVYAKARAATAGSPATAMLGALRVVTLFGFPVGIALALLSRDAVLVLFSDRWEPAIAPMTLIALAAGVSSIGFASGDLFAALGRPGMLLAVNVPFTALMLVGFVLVVPYGLAAVAAVHLASVLIDGVVRLALAHRLAGTRWADDLVAMWPAVCAAAGALAVGLPVRLVLEPGPVALVCIAAAVTAGAGAGLFIGARPALRDMTHFAREVLAR